MKKTINVTLGGLVFALEEDAYNRLSAYLDSLKAHFSRFSYGSEVVSDIETRIAEDFTAKTRGAANKAVTLADVESIIKSIGNVEDFSEEKQSENKSETQKSGRKFYRNPDDAIIGGVGSGLAAYFGIDTILVRVLLVVFVLAGGWGIPLYLLLWLIVPEAKTAAEKLEMKGSPVTIREIEQTAKNKINEVRTSGGGRRFADFVAKLIKIFVRIVLGFVGIVVTFASAVAALSVTFGIINLFFNRNSPYIDFPVGTVFSGPAYFITLLLALVTVVIPLIYIAIAGVSLVKFRKPAINGMLTGILASIWVLAAVASSVVWINKAPAIKSAVDAYRGNVETRDISVADFTQIDASSAYKLNVIPGAAYSVKITGHTHDLDLAKIEKSNTTLVVGQKDNFRICFFCWSDPVTIDITAPALESVKGSGAVRYSVGSYKADDFTIDLSGASRVAVEDLTASKTTINLSGASSVTLSGKTTDLSMDLSGASRVNGFSLSAENVNSEESGSSHVEITATKSLSAQASGASTLFYKGSPKLGNIDESGSSHIRAQ